MNGTKICSAGFLIAVLLLGCGREVTDVSQRGGSGTETVGIAGSVVDTNNSPVSGAIVKLRRADYIDTTQDGLKKTSLYYGGTETNDSGKFFFGNVDTGKYKIEIIDGNRNAALLACTVSNANSLKVFAHQTLRPTGSITGKIPPSFEGAQGVTAYVYGLDAYATTSPSGDFVLADIPEGAYTVRFVSNSPVYLSFDTSGIAIVSGAKYDIGQFDLPRKSLSIFPADSIALNRILDSNGLHSVIWQQVATVGPWPFRITELRMDYKKVNTLPSEIGQLYELQVLSAEGNTLSSLPQEIGNLLHLKTLSVKNNRISSLPAELGKLDSLVNLDVSYNQLSRLPDGMGNCGSLQVNDVGFNQITSIPEELFYCHSLKAVIIRNNSLDSLPESIGLLRDINYLDAQYNTLWTLPWQIQRLHQDYRFVNFDYNALCQNLPQDITDWLNTASADTVWQQTQQCGK
jgi:hypothetical protein